MLNKYYPKDLQLVKWVTKDGKYRYGQFYKKEYMFCYVYDENTVSEWDITANVKQWHPTLDLHCTDCTFEFSSTEHTICPKCHSGLIVDIEVQLKSYTLPKTVTALPDGTL